MNRFRTKIKRIGKGQDSKSSSEIKPSVVSGTSSPSTGFLGLGSKDKPRKATSVSSPPDVSSSPIHMVS